MAEYINVEKPFLEKLRQIGWTIIDKGEGLPYDPSDSLRTSFSEVILRDIFNKALVKLNPWITQPQIDYCYERIAQRGNQALLEANKDVYSMLAKGITLKDKNEITGEDNPTVKLIAFGEQYAENSFIAINQFKVDTPTTAKNCIIPDIVCFINGLPIVVIECKDLYVAEPLSDAFTQIRRYSNCREDYYSNKEGEERLFHTNAFNVITYGTEARFGTISADFDYYFNWKDIFPEVYKVIQTDDEGERQEVLILGMFNHEILVDIIKNFTLFMHLKSGEEIKVISRYQQYRAVGKMISRLKENNDKSWQERSGVIWHTQGSGKSLTMVFLIKKMRSCFDLKDYKIMMVVDRLDLEEQLMGDAELTGEKVNRVENKASLVQLSDDTADLNMVMIHKFGINQKISAQSLLAAGIIPQYETFKEINPSDKLLILIDEAHRSQNGDMGDNLFMAFPNATRIGFTGTPLITERHKVKTAERFGQPKNEYIDTYKMNNAVDDNATVDIKYIGKRTNDHIKDKEIFDLEYEATFKNRSEAERQEIQRRYGKMINYLESKERIKPIARDIMEHYVKDILPNGFKAQVVASSIIAAVRYKVEINNLIPEFLARELEKPEEERDEILINRLQILKARAVVSTQGNNEEEYIRVARNETSTDNAITNFKKDFDIEKSENELTGIGILCVCDRLLTGFDAPIEQVMYLDKNLREHDLLQAIARVNRTKKGKKHGIVVDYFGVTKNLHKALGIYTDQEALDAAEDLKEFEEYFKDINKEIPELELRYRKIVQKFEEAGISDFEEFLKQTITIQSREQEIAEKVIDLAADLKFRAEFDFLVKNYFDRLDLLFNHVETQREHWVPAKRIGYLIWRIRYHYKDDTLDLRWASEKVRRLLDKHIASLGITQHVEEISLLSDDFPKKVDDLYKSSKSKASAMEHALRQSIKVNLESSDPYSYQKFKDRIDSIITNYQNNWDLMVKELEEARADIIKGRVDPVVPHYQAPLFDLLRFKADDETKANEEMFVKLTEKIMDYLAESLRISNFWQKGDEEKTLRGNIEEALRFSGNTILRKDHNAIATEILKLAKSNQSSILRNHP